jgi:hypothetical protein
MIRKTDLVSFGARRRCIVLLWQKNIFFCGIRTYFFTLLFSFILAQLFAQKPFPYIDKIYDPNIQTVQFFKSGTTNSYPILELNKPDEPLLLSFDVFNHPQLDLQYTLIHCNAGWQPDNLFTNDYLDGSTYESVTHYEPSFNALQRYYHYWLHVPGIYIRPKISGNYILKVYLADNPDSILITRRFYVVENKVLIASDVKQPTYATYRNTKQEIDFWVNYKGLDVMNPLNDMKVVVRQNQRWDNEITGLTPKYINDQVMDFDFEEGNLFDGGSEFRYLDLSTYTYAGWGVNKIFLDTLYNMVLHADDDRSYTSYSFWTDINGERVIASNDKNQKYNELDYFIAHFTLLTPYPYEEGGVYIFGALSDWQIKPEFRMTYNAEKNCYQGSAKLKQGYYNFQYVFVDNQTGLIETSRFEGDHFETENNYLILVYFRSAFLNADELLGVSIINSRRR